MNEAHQRREARDTLPPGQKQQKAYAVLDEIAEGLADGTLELVAKPRCPESLSSLAIRQLVKNYRYREAGNMSQQKFDVSGLVPFMLPTPEELKAEGLVFSIYPPNVHTCEQVVSRLANGPAPAGLELGEIISHFKDAVVAHTDACRALSAKHLEDMLDEEIALFRKALTPDEEEE